MFQQLSNLFLVNVLFLSLTNIIHSKPISMVITSPLTDLRASAHQAPTGIKGPALSRDIKGEGLGQISQLLFGEKIFAEHSLEFPGWIEATSLEQKDAEGNPMKGYIQKSHATEVQDFFQHNLVVTSQNARILLASGNKKITTSPLPFGTKLPGKHISERNYWLIMFSNDLQGLVSKDDAQELSSIKTNSEQEIRNSIVEIAKKFIDTPYVWGGNSMQQSHLKHKITGIDCSNLLRLTFSMHDMEIPRNSRSQEIVAKKIATGDLLQPGDAIFFTGTKNKQMCHVALYAGDDHIIEASGLLKSNGKIHSNASLYPAKDRKKLCVRIVSLKEYLGKTAQELKNGTQVTHGIRKGATMYLGTFF